MHIKLPRLSALLRNPEFSLKFRPSATNLICNIINGLNIKSIAIPAYLCQEIITSINLSTLKVIYYEIDNAYSPLLEEKHLNCDCLFICDYFGYPVKKTKEIDLFFSIDAKTIIFDRSHSLLAGINNFDESLLEIKNKLFFVYSLRKFIPTINGGLIVSNTNINDLNYENNLIGTNSFMK